MRYDEAGNFADRPWGPRLLDDARSGIDECGGSAKRQWVDDGDQLRNGWRVADFEQADKGGAAHGEVLIRRLGTDLWRRLSRDFGWRSVAQMRAFCRA